jgi:hypothetical protein
MRLFRITGEFPVKIPGQQQDMTGTAHDHWPDRPGIIKKYFAGFFL